MDKNNLKQKILAEIEPLIKDLEKLEACQELSFASANRSRVPKKPGVYTIYRDGIPVYVGESSNLQARFSAHRSGSGSELWRKLQEEGRFPKQDDIRIRKIVIERCTFKFLGLSADRDIYQIRRRLEAFLQAIYQPKLNFLPVKERKKERNRLFEEIDEASKRGDMQMVGKLARKLRESESRQ
jgi:hypothetical protein